MTSDEIDDSISSFEERRYSSESIEEEHLWPVPRNVNRPYSIPEAPPRFRLATMNWYRVNDRWVMAQDEAAARAAMAWKDVQSVQTLAADTRPGIQVRHRE